VIISGGVITRFSNLSPVSAAQLLYFAEIANRRLSSLALLFALVMVSNPALSHDINGVLQEQALPERVRSELKIRQQIRLHQRRGESITPTMPDKRGPETQSKYETLEGIVQALALWDQGARLSACFMNGNAQAEKEVMAVFEEVISLTNLRIQKSNCKRDSIRISFRHAGYSSYIGRDLLLIDVGTPTMVLENLDLALPLSPLNKGRVVHEFMHALGVMHEHQHPDAGCENEILWSVIQEQWKWTDKQMETNFRQIVRTDAIHTTPYDKDSLMHYQLDARFLRSGERSSCHSSALRTAMSEGDRKLLEETYPQARRSQ